MVKEDGGALIINDGEGTVTNVIAGDDDGSLLLRPRGLGGVGKASHLRAFPTTNVSRTSRVALAVSATFKSDLVALTISDIAADAIDAT